MKPNYDEIQMAAVLTYCLVCHRHYYMTKPQAVCCRCRQMAEGKAVPAIGKPVDERLSIGSAS